MSTRTSTFLITLIVVFAWAIGVSLLSFYLLGYPQDLILSMPICGLLGWNIDKIERRIADILARKDA